MVIYYIRTVRYTRECITNIVNCKFSVCQSVHHHTFNWINQQDAANSQVYYVSFKYSSTCFGHIITPIIRSYNNCSSSLISYRIISNIINYSVSNASRLKSYINPLNPELNPICYLLALLEAHHFLHVSRIRVKLLTFRLLMLYIYGAPILDVSRSHTTTQHSR